MRIFAALSANSNRKAKRLIQTNIPKRYENFTIKKCTTYGMRCIAVYNHEL